jgi:hypothetical protein
MKINQILSLARKGQEVSVTAEQAANLMANPPSGEATSCDEPPVVCFVVVGTKPTRLTWIGGASVQDVDFALCLGKGGKFRAFDYQSAEFDELRNFRLRAEQYGDSRTVREKKGLM